MMFHYKETSKPEPTASRLEGSLLTARGKTHYRKCNDCWREAIKGKSRCLTHKINSAEYAAETYRGLKQAGICPRCRKPVEGRVYHVDCARVINRRGRG